MKSLSNNTIGAMALLLALGSWSATAPSGVSAITGSSASVAKATPTEELQRPPGDDELPTAQNHSRRDQASSEIKCWQYGRLIFNEHDWKMAGPGAPGGQLYSSSGSYTRLQLMPFGETFCMLKHGAR